MEIQSGSSSKTNAQVPDRMGHQFRDLVVSLCPRTHAPCSVPTTENVKPCSLQQSNPSCLDDDDEGKLVIIETDENAPTPEIGPNSVKSSSNEQPNTGHVIDKAENINSKYVDTLSQDQDQPSITKDSSAPIDGSMKLQEVGNSRMESSNNFSSSSSANVCEPPNYRGPKKKILEGFLSTPPSPPAPQPATDDSSKAEVKGRVFNLRSCIEKIIDSQSVRECLTISYVSPPDPQTFGRSIISKLEEMKKENYGGKTTTSIDAPILLSGIPGTLPNNPRYPPLVDLTQDTKEDVISANEVAQNDIAITKILAPKTLPNPAPPIYSDFSQVPQQPHQHVASKPSLNPNPLMYSNFPHQPVASKPSPKPNPLMYSNFSQQPHQPVASKPSPKPNPLTYSNFSKVSPQTHQPVAIKSSLKSPSLIYSDRSQVPHQSHQPTYRQSISVQGQDPHINFRQNKHNYEQQHDQQNQMQQMIGNEHFKQGTGQQAYLSQKSVTNHNRRNSLQTSLPAHQKLESASNYSRQVESTETWPVTEEGALDLSRSEPVDEPLDLTIKKPKENQPVLNLSSNWHVPSQGIHSESEHHHFNQPPFTAKVENKTHYPCYRHYPVQTSSSNIEVYQESKSASPAHSRSVPVERAYQHPVQPILPVRTQAQINYSHEINSQTIRTYQQPNYLSPNVQLQGLSVEYVQTTASSMNQKTVSTRGTEAGNCPTIMKQLPQKAPVGLPDSAGKVSLSPTVKAVRGVNSLIGEYATDDVLYLRCCLCQSTYGNPHNFRRHFLKTHGFEPSKEHAAVVTISAFKKNVSAASVLGSKPHPPQMQKPDKANPSIQTRELISPIKNNHDQSNLISDQKQGSNGKQPPGNFDQTSNSSMQCFHCGQEFPARDWGIFKRHMRAHDNHDNNMTYPSTETFPCNLCGVSFPNQNACVKHMKAAHNVPAVPKCLLCLHTFDDMPSLSMHSCGHEHVINNTSTTTAAPSVVNNANLVSSVSGNWRASPDSTNTVEEDSTLTKRQVSGRDDLLAQPKVSVTTPDKDSVAQSKSNMLEAYSKMSLYEIVQMKVEEASRKLLASVDSGMESSPSSKEKVSSDSSINPEYLRTLPMKDKEKYVNGELYHAIVSANKDINESNTSGEAPQSSPAKQFMTIENTVHKIVENVIQEEAIKEKKIGKPSQPDAPNNTKQQMFAPFKDTNPLSMVPGRDRETVYKDIIKCHNNKIGERALSQDMISKSPPPLRTPASSSPEDKLVTQNLISAPSSGHPIHSPHATNPYLKPTNNSIVSMSSNNIVVSNSNGNPVINLPNNNQHIHSPRTNPALTNPVSNTFVSSHNKNPTLTKPTGNLAAYNLNSDQYKRQTNNTPVVSSQENASVFTNQPQVNSTIGITKNHPIVIQMEDTNIGNPCNDLPGCKPDKTPTVQNTKDISNPTYSISDLTSNKSNSTPFGNPSNDSISIKPNSTPFGNPSNDSISSKSNSTPISNPSNDSISSKSNSSPFGNPSNDSTSSKSNSTPISNPGNDSTSSNSNSTPVSNPSNDSTSSKSNSTPICAPISDCPSSNSNSTPISSHNCDYTSSNLNSTPTVSNPIGTPSISNPINNPCKSNPNNNPSGTIVNSTPSISDNSGTNTRSSPSVNNSNNPSGTNENNTPYIMNPNKNLTASSPCSPASFSNTNNTLQANSANNTPSVSKPDNYPSASNPNSTPSINIASYSPFVSIPNDHLRIGGSNETLSVGNPSPNPVSKSTDDKLHLAQDDTSNHDTFDSSARSPLKRGAEDGTCDIPAKSLKNTI